MTLNIPDTIHVKTVKNITDYHFLFDGPSGKIEALLTVPELENVHDAIGVVCHPHPLHGGTMTNKVAHTAAKSFVEIGAPTLRFNFRGVDKSEGVFDEGMGEQDDLVAAVSFMRDYFPFESLWLAGFSFGAFVAFKAHKKANASQLVTIAPPVRMFNFDQAQLPGCPWLLIQGMADEVVSAEEILTWANSLEHPPKIATLDGASHFFHGRLNDLKAIILDNLASS